MLLRIVRDATAVASVVAAYDPHVLFEVLMTDRAAHNQVDVEMMLDRLLEATPATYRQLASPASSRYWPLVLNGGHAYRIASTILNTTGVDTHAGQVASALRRVATCISVSFPLACALRRRLALLEAVLAPQGLLTSPRDIINAVGELPQTQRRQIALQLLPRLAASVASQDTSAACRDLELLLEFATTHASCGADAGLRAFAQAALADGGLLADPLIATAAVAHAFGATNRQPDGVQERNRLLDLGVELTSLYARAGGPALNREINERAMRWPEPARSFFRLARQHRRVNGRFLARLARCARY